MTRILPCGILFKILRRDIGVDVICIDFQVKVTVTAYKI